MFFSVSNLRFSGRRIWFLSGYNVCRRQLGAVFASFFLLLCAVSGSVSVDDAYAALVLRARAGETAPALAWLRERGDDVSLTQLHDHILIASWAGQPDEVVSVYGRLPQDGRENLPADAQIAVARAFRDLKRWPQALGFWRQGLERHGASRSDFAAGLVMTLADAGQQDEAIRIGLGQIKKWKNDAELHMALAYVRTLQGRAFDALYHTDRALVLAPQAAWIQDDYVRALSRAGLAEQALERARRYPARFKGGVLRALEADVAALKTRLAIQPTRSEAERFVIADRALALYDGMISAWRTLGQEAAADLVRIRIDRLSALHARVRMADLVREYEQLLAERVNVPAWALANVASAYLYLRQPEKARDLYRRVLAELEATVPAEEWSHLGPANARLGSEIGLFYALSEAEQFKEMESVLARIAAYQPAWLYFKGNPLPDPNPNYLVAQTTLVAADMAKDNMPAAQAKMEEMVRQAPNNASLLATLGGIYRARSLPRLGEAQLKMAETLEPRALDVETGQGLVALDLQEWRQAEQLSADTLRRFPENLTVQRLARLWQVHNMAELRVSSHYSLASKTSSTFGSSPVSGKGDFGIDSVLYSAPVKYNWRAFAGLGHAQGKFQEGRGHYNYLRGGLEWRSRDLWIEGEISANRYGHGIRAGARLAASYDFSDHWQIGGSLEYLSRQTPVRALHSDITSDTAQAYIRWLSSDRRQWQAGLSVSHFSDGNDRVGVDLNGIERLYTNPNLKIDALFNASSQHNSRDANRPYFNPQSDLLLLPALRGTHRLYRRYETVWEHFLTLSAGVYNQKYYDSGEVLGIAYGHRFRHNDVFEIGATLDAVSRPYDGRREKELRLLLDLTSRF